MSNKQVTSLSLQLKKLQVPQVQALLNVDASKRRVSFLYDPKEAANLDAESVYCLALNGLEQLKLIDDRLFTTFEETLFNKTSITFERLIQTKNINDNLSGEIKRFLIHVSPYFMLKATHKTIEWLVYRYQIHLYNVNELFMCILPYYETQLFIRATQMLSLEQLPLWSWLENNAKSGVPLASQTLAQHVINDPSFLNFLISYVNDAINVYRVDEDNDEGKTSYSTNGINLLSSFFTKTFIQALNTIKETVSLNQNYNAFISQLLPFLYKLLKSYHSIEIKQSVYLILTLLFKKFTFNKESCEKTLIMLFKSVQKNENELFKSSFLTCCLIIKSQVNNNDHRKTFYKIDYDHDADEALTTNELALILNSQNYLNKKFLKQFLKLVDNNDESQNDYYLDYIINLNDNYKLNEFIKQFYDCLLYNILQDEDETNQEFNTNEKFLIKFVSRLNFQSKINDSNDDNESVALLKYMIEILFCLLAFSKLDNGRKLNFLNQLLKQYERKYPTIFDSILNSLFNSNSKLNTELKQKLQDNLNLKSLIKYNYIDGNNASNVNDNLFILLQHANEVIRLNAFSYLFKHYESYSASNDENVSNELVNDEFLKTQLTIKLNDKSASIIRILIKFKFYLLKIFQFKELSAKLIENLFFDNSTSIEDVDMNVNSDDADVFECKKQVLKFIFSDLYEYSIAHSTNTETLLNDYADLVIKLTLNLIENQNKLNVNLKLLNYLTNETKLFQLNEKFMSINENFKKLKVNNSELANEQVIFSYYKILKEFLIKNFSQYLQDTLNAVGVANAKLSLNQFFKFDLLLDLIRIHPDNSVSLHNTCFSLLKQLNTKLKFDKKQLKQLMNEIENGNNSESFIDNEVSLFTDGYLNSIKTNSIQLNLYISLFKKYLKLINSNQQCLSQTVYSYLCLKSSNKNASFIHLIKLFLRYSFENDHQKLLDFLMNYLISSNPRTEIVDTSDSEEIAAYKDEILKLRSLQLIHINFSNADLEENENTFNALKSVKNEQLIDELILLLTCSLANKHQQIRNEGLSCLRSINNYLKQHNNENLKAKWYNFIKKLLKNSDEIILDSTYLIGTDLFEIKNEAVEITRKSNLNKYLNIDILNTVGELLLSDSSKHQSLLIDCLNLFKNISSELKFCLFESHIVKYFKNKAETNQVCELLFKYYILNEHTSKYFNSNESLFQTIIIGNLNTKFNYVILNRLLLASNNNFFEILDTNLKYQFIDCVFFKLYHRHTAGDHDLDEKLNEMIKLVFLNLIIDSNLFIKLLNKINATSADDKNVEMAKSTKELKKQMKQAKQQQVDESSTVSRLNNNQLNDLKLIVELIQVKLNESGSSLENQSGLVRNLFEKLNNVFEQQQHYQLEKEQKQQQESSVSSGEFNDEIDYLNEYIQLSILDSILELFKLNLKTVNNEDYNIELLIQMLKLSNNLRVQQKILLVLSELAFKFADKILDNVLVMFVFVGNKLIRKDDMYSLNIITKTINTIIPVILKAKSIDTTSTRMEIDGYNSSDRDINPIVCKILQSFVITLPYIPNHRKMLIFNELLKIIGIDSYLWIIILQLFDYYFVENKKQLNNESVTASTATAKTAIIPKSNNTNVTNDKKLRETLKQCTQILLNLFNQFKFDNILKSIINLIEFLNKFDSKSSQQQQVIDKNYDFLNIKLNEYTNIERKYLIYNLIQLINELLINNFSSSSDESNNINYIIGDNANSTNSTNSRLYETLIENLLIGIINLNKKQQQLTTTNASEDDLKFTKAILNKYYDCMENLILNLNTNLFINIIRKLIKNEHLLIKRRILILLNNKLRKQDFIDDNESILLLTLIDDLLNEIKIIREHDKMNTDYEINNQTILFTIKLLTKRIAEKNSIAFMKVLKYICENLIEKKLYLSETSSSSNKTILVNQNFLASVLLCLGELCFKLKSSCLIYLNKIINFIFEIIKQDDSLSNDLLILSCITCLFKITNNLANFLSPYLRRLIDLSCTLQQKKLINEQQQQHQAQNSNLSVSSMHFSHQNISISSDIGIDIDAYINQHQQQSQNQSKSMQQIEFKLNQLRVCLASNIPIRLLVPVLNEELTTNTASASVSSAVKFKASTTIADATTTLIKDNLKLDTIEYYMQIVKLSLQNSSQEDILANMRLLKGLFLNLFNLRTFYSNNKSPNDLCKSEDNIIDTFCELTFKLSEETFRPIFFNIVEWATLNEPPKDRLITFYRISYKLSLKLKNLFVLFSSHFIKNAVDTLDLLNQSKTDENFFLNKKDRTKYIYSNEKSRLLLFNIVDTLSNLFLHDTDKFLLNNDRFNVIMQPLVDQIDNEIEFDNYKNYINEHLTPCIANFAYLCIQDTTLCRKLNYQILLKTKSSSVQVRLASLDVLREVSKKLGDIYNSIFTETAPFLAELMEDPVEEVEEKVQTLVKELEDMLGESLQGHFV